jgi:hypothetical protein
VPTSAEFGHRTVRSDKRHPVSTVQTQARSDVMNHGKRLTKLGLAAAVGLGMGNAHAVLQSYTDFDDFKADLLAAGISYRVHDFNNFAPGTIIKDGDTLDDLTFSSISINEAGVSMMISNLLPGTTLSPDNSLGTSSLPLGSGGTDNQFQNPDNFVIRFPESYAFGLWFQSTTPVGGGAGIQDGDFTITLTERAPAANSSRSSLNADSITIGASANGWFVGFIDSDSPFSTAAISSLTDPDFLQAFQFRIDDIYTAAAASAPSTLALLMFGAGLIHFRRRKAAD